MGISQLSTAITDPQQFLKSLGAIPAFLGDLEVDVIVRESPEHSWDITTHPTESGSDLNDLRKRRPDVLVLDCIWVDKQYGVHDIASNLLSGEGLIPETWRDKYESLKELWGKNEPITVVTGLDSYANMVIDRVSPIREQSTAGCLSCTVSLQEVRIVSTEERLVDTSLLPTAEEKSDDVKKKTSKKKNKNTKTNKPANDGGKEETSLLYDMFG